MTRAPLRDDFCTARSNTVPYVEQAQSQHSKEVATNQSTPTLRSARPTWRNFNWPLFWLVCYPGNCKEKSSLVVKSSLWGIVVQCTAGSLVLFWCWILWIVILNLTKFSVKYVSDIKTLSMNQMTNRKKNTFCLVLWDVPRHVVNNIIREDGNCVRLSGGMQHSTISWWEILSSRYC